MVQRTIVHDEVQSVGVRLLHLSALEMKNEREVLQIIDKISCVQLRTTSLRPSTSWANRYKLGLVLIVERVFNAPDSNVSIDMDTLSIIYDLDTFFAYPWYKVGYRYMLKGFWDSWVRRFREVERKKEKR